jgi:CheY-like chemotaxis protein
LKAPSLKILVVDDLAVNKVIAEKMLVLLGFSPDFVSHGGDAIEAVKASHYDIIFMDLQMPEVDGFAATRAIRAWQQAQGAPRQSTKIVAFTAYVTEDVRRECVAAGMDDFLGKPVNLEMLRSVIEHVATRP